MKDLIIEICEEYDKGAEVEEIAARHNIPKEMVIECLVEWYGATMACSPIPRGFFDEDGGAA